ncbi:hypothetical protein [Lonepinella koalarum]|nr:hypothetical protein [Lonepinella koalarum]
MKNIISEQDYLSELEKTFLLQEKRSKGKDKYKIKDTIEVTNHRDQVYISISEIYANHSILNIFKKSESITMIQGVYFSVKTKRILMAIISSRTTNFDANKLFFIDIVSSLSESLEGI